MTAAGRRATRPAPLVAQTCSAEAPGGQADAAGPGPSQGESGGWAGGGEGAWQGPALTGMMLGVGVCVWCLQCGNGQAEAVKSCLGDPGGKQVPRSVPRLTVTKWRGQGLPGRVTPPTSSHSGLLLWVKPGTGVQGVGSPRPALIQPLPPGGWSGSPV